MTLTATAKKLGVSIYHYIQIRVAGAFELPDLADTITQRAAELSLGGILATSITGSPGLLRRYAFSALASVSPPCRLAIIQHNFA